MFDGSFKSKRTINLGGNKQQIDKQKLLKQAQEERRIRETERLRLKAAERIQAWYRGRTVATKVRQELRADWDQETQELRKAIQAAVSSTVSATGLATGPEASMPLSTIESLSAGIESVVRKLLIFFRPRMDHARLAQLCNLLMLSVTEPRSCRLVTIPFYSARSADHQDAWRLLLGRLIPILVQLLGEGASWSDVNLESALSVLDTVSLTESFQDVQDSNQSVVLSRGFSQVLTDAGVFQRIAQFLSRISLDDKKRPSVAKALLLSMRICRMTDHTMQHSDVLDQFTVHIMTLPLLPNRMTIETLATFTSRLPLDAILIRLSSNNCAIVASLPQYRISPFLANILAFGYQRVVKMHSTTSSAYLHVLTILLGMIPLDSIEVVSKRPTDDDDEDMDDMEWRSEGASGLSPTLPNHATKLDPKIMRWLSLAHDSNHLNDIFGSVGSSNSPTAVKIVSPSGKNGQEVLSTESIGELTQFLLNLITLFPSQKISILSNLMYFKFGSKTKRMDSSVGTGGDTFFGVSIIKVFLDAFMSTTLYGLLLQSMQKDSPLGVPLVLDPQHARAWSLLTFVSELYCLILVTMGDDEFHDEARNPISLRSVITLSSVARDVAFLLWWNDNALDMESNLGGSKNLKIGYLRDIVTKLTRQLHARDSRRTFCPKNHWLLSMPLDMLAFKRAVIQDEESLSHDQDQDDHEEEDTVMNEPGSGHRRRIINRQQRSSQVARLSPRLGVLNNIPFVIRFEDRVAIFRAFVESDRQRTPGLSGMFHPHPVGHAQIHRGSVFEDGYEYLNHLGPKLKGRIAISFIDQYGIPEAGIDGGGVFKEFLTSLVLQAFNTNYGLFMSTSDQLLYPNPHRFAQEQTQLKHYEFLGRILGKALYEGILIDAAFAGFFLSKCLGQVNYLDDLPSLDPTLYRGLMFLKNYEGNVEDLSLYFTVDDEEMGQTITRELIRNGSNTLVTRQNRIEYIYKTAHYRLNTQIDKQCKAFFRGLSDLIDPKWLWMFNQQELQVMLGGAQTAISLSDLEQNVVYSNFERTDRTIEYFWDVVKEMSEGDRRSLVKFVTSCARPPLLGFAELNPKICIRNAGQEEDRLPTSSTCMNLLKLPAFTSRERLKEKLMYAIHSEAGFDLS